MSEVFISYSRADNEFVDGLIRDLEQNGVPVWLDRHDIEGGTAWRAAISEAIRRCRAFVIVLSPNSTGSKNVSRELSLAESHDRTIIPIIYQACDIPAGMEYQLAELQWINLTNMTYEEGLRRLLKVLTKGAETMGVAPAQNVEKRRSDTARLRQILEEGAERSQESHAPGVDPSIPAVAPRVEAAQKSSTSPAPPSPAVGKKLPLIPAVIAGAVLVAAGGGYAIYRSSSSAAPETIPTPTPALASAQASPSSNPNTSLRPATTPSKLSANPAAQATPTPAASDDKSASLIAATRQNINRLATGNADELVKVAGNMRPERMLDLWNKVS